MDFGSMTGAGAGWESMVSRRLSDRERARMSCSGPPRPAHRPAGPSRSQARSGSGACWSWRRDWKSVARANSVACAAKKGPAGPLGKGAVGGKGHRDGAENDETSNLAIGQASTPHTMNQHAVLSQSLLNSGLTIPSRMFPMPLGLCRQRACARIVTRRSLWPMFERAGSTEKPAVSSFAAISSPS